MKNFGSFLLSFTSPLPLPWKRFLNFHEKVSICKMPTLAMLSFFALSPANFCCCAAGISSELRSFPNCHENCVFVQRQGWNKRKKVETERKKIQTFFLCSFQFVVVRRTQVFMLVGFCPKLSSIRIERNDTIETIEKAHIQFPFLSMVCLEAIKSDALFFSVSLFPE